MNTSERHLLERETSASRPMNDEQDALFRYTERLYRADTPEDFYDAALSAILSALRCQRASILLFDEAGVMRFVASLNLSPEYRAAVEGHTPWKPGEPEPKPLCVENIATSDFDDAVKATIKSEGIGGLAFIPLTENGKTIGKFMAYHDRPHVFTEREIELGLSVARQLGFCLARRKAEERVRQSAAQLSLMMDTAPVPICHCDPDQRFRLVNRAYAERFGLTPADCIGKTIVEVLGEEPYAVFREHVEAALRGVRVDFEAEVPYREPLGLRYMRCSYAPEFDESGKVIGFVGVINDFTERRRTQDRLRESEERFRLVAESAPVMLWMGDQNGKCLYLNKPLREFWGVTLEDVPKFDWNTTIHPDDREALFAPFAEGMSRHKGFTVAARYRRASDGEYRVLSTESQPRFGANGEFLGMIGVNVDITDRLRAEEQRTLLINELNHRVKNTLATVQSLAMQTLRTTERSEHARAGLEARLAALSRAHDVLTRESWQGAGLSEVVDRAIEPFATGRSRFNVRGPNIRLSPKQALAISMALHELATNAAKYGALSNDGGNVEVTWLVAPANGLGQLQMTWAESGGPAVARPERVGFGSRLISRSLGLDLGADASIDYRETGVVCAIRTPLEHAGAYG